MRVDLRILRYDPERDTKPHWEAYHVESDPKLDKVLDLLHRVKYEQDGTLTFRRSCAHGVCGSDAMLINGRNRLACKIRVEQLGARRITVAPLPGLPVVKDLVVDMDDFFAKYRSVRPYLVNDSPTPARERLQSAAERTAYDDTTKCILCAACTSSIRATRAVPSAWRSSPTRMGCGAAGRSSTAPMRVHAGSGSPRRSSRSVPPSSSGRSRRDPVPGARRGRGGRDRT
jgi:succinate dehydrogenase/fumarate reductase iron-sulfur protein